MAGRPLRLSWASDSAPCFTGDVDHKGLPVIAFATVAEWERWLNAEAAGSAGIWLKISKRGADEQTISYAEALEAALCFGWIDGQKAPLDEHHWLQRFAQRKPRSRWSKINTQKAETLAAAGRMRPAGQLEVERAKADGRWDAAYSGQRDAQVPDDLRQALDADKTASEFFETISSVNRYAILYRISAVKRPETRARKIAQYVRMLAEHKTIHP
jgi:uncharacterized protein YdeI (YjbR/CyaY-like superfamily)